DGSLRTRDAMGRWSVITTIRPVGQASGEPGKSLSFSIDRAGNLYVAGGGEVRKRDAQGNWTIVASPAGSTAGQVNDPRGWAVDRMGNLFVAVRYPNHWLQERDVQGNWSVIAAGQVTYP